MTPERLEHIQRAYDRAKMTSPQAVFSWAGEFARELFDGVGCAPPIVANDGPDRTEDLVSALRPFAAFGAPVVIAALDKARSEFSYPADAFVFAVGDPSASDAYLAAVTLDHCQAAYDLINAIDGCGGA